MARGDFLVRAETFRSPSFDPVGLEFKGRLSCDTILPILIAAGVRRRFGLTTALAAPMSLVWNGPVKQ